MVTSTSSTYNIVNSFIVSNGNISTSTYGGVSIQVGTSNNVLEFNTIALNATQPGVVDGIDCTNNGLVARNNIVVGLVGKPHVNIGSNCVHQYSLFTPDNLAAGQGNMLVTDQAQYMFQGGTDFHIRSGSVAVGQAQSTGLTGDSLFDFDGDVRVLNGSTVDVGADEIP